MSKHIEDAMKLSDAMLKARRTHVDAILMHGKTTTQDLERLAVINSTIALAAEIQADEQKRYSDESYRRHEEAGTLVDDGFGNKIAPPVK